MATLLAPYNSAMQLGSGFNSFTQQNCVDRAVVPEDSPAVFLEKDRKVFVPQQVTFKSSIVDKATDVTNEMDINAAFAIKYDSFRAAGTGTFVDTSKIKESDVSFMISVKVVNQKVYNHSLTKFNPIPELETANITDIYGDCFISRFQEGGEFTAVLSIKSSDRRKANSMKAQAAITLTKEKLDLQMGGQFDKDLNDLLKENETTISVTWTGGGQNLKRPEAEWTIETMRLAALKFPQLVAETPMRTHAILTKYSALRSFYTATLKASGKKLVPNFENAGVYMGLVQEAYLDYKTIAKNLQILAFEVSAGHQQLIEAPAAKGTTADGTKPNADGDRSGSDASSIVPVEEPKPWPTKPYPPSLIGVESARQTVRNMLNRIVAEVDVVSKTPEVATDEDRQPPYMSPFLSKSYCPLDEQKVQRKRRYQVQRRPGVRDSQVRAL